MSSAKRGKVESGQEAIEAASFTSKQELKPDARTADRLAGDGTGRRGGGTACRPTGRCSARRRRVGGGSGDGRFSPPRPVSHRAAPPGTLTNVSPLPIVIIFFFIINGRKTVFFVATVVRLSTLV